jgi:hypothetical protein
MSRKAMHKAIEAPEGAFAYERGKFGANPAMSGFCFDINISCRRRTPAMRVFSSEVDTGLREENVSK